MNDHHNFTENDYLSILKHEQISCVPNFCNPVEPLFINKLKNSLFFKALWNKDNQIITELGDFTSYKLMGFSSTWVYAPPINYHANPKLQDFLNQQNNTLKKMAHFNTDVKIDILGGIYQSNSISNWYVKAGIQSESQLKFFLDNLSIDFPTTQQLDQYSKGRQQMIEKHIIPIVAENLITEPANISLPLGLTAKLMRTNPELLNEFYSFLAKRTEMAFQTALKMGMKIFCIEDESGFKTGPFFSPQQYHQFVTPHAKRICDLIHEKGGMVIMYTDGFVESLIPHFIDAGFDALQPIEPNSGMSIKKIRSLYGKRLTLIGNVDTNSILSFGTIKDVQSAVQKCFRDAMGENGKISEYIFATSGSFHGSVKVENVVQMIKEYEKMR